MKILLVNPYICDFACYDYWSKPLGLLYLSSILKEKGHNVDLVDCMDRHHAFLPDVKDDKYGRGRFISQIIEKPGALIKYPRYYSAYGIYGNKLHNILKDMSRPDIVAVTSSMTYWYPGVRDTVIMIKELFEGVPVVLGGVYSTLCMDHARENIPADYIVAGSDFKEFFNLIGEQVADFEEWPIPDYSSYKKIPYIVLRTSIGCPREECSFCGVKKVSTSFKKKSKEKISNEIEYMKTRFNVRDFVFYDDSLFENDGLIEYLKTTDGSLRFHTPNAIEVSKVSGEISELLKNSGFVDPCLAIDIVDENRMSVSGAKLRKTDIEKAVYELINTGYKKGEVSTYMIMGLPEQTLEELKAAADYINGLGLKIRLAEYAVVPGSRDGQKFAKEIIDEPLLHNNSIFPSYLLDEWDEIFRFKEYVKRLNNSLIVNSQTVVSE